MPTESPPLLRPSEIARELGVAPASVRRWIAEGRLEAVRLGDGPVARLRVRPEALAAFVRPVKQL